MENANGLPYNFTEKEFTYNDVQYKVCLTPELYSDGEGLDFTGNYVGILISETRGTIAFELEADAHMKWVPTPKFDLNPGIVDELDKIIQELRTSQ